MSFAGSRPSKHKQAYRDSSRQSYHSVRQHVLSRHCVLLLRGKTMSEMRRSAYGTRISSRSFRAKPRLQSALAKAGVAYCTRSTRSMFVAGATDLRYIFSHFVVSFLLHEHHPPTSLPPSPQASHTPLERLKLPRQPLYAFLVGRFFRNIPITLEARPRCR